MALTCGVTSRSTWVRRLLTMSRARRVTASGTDTGFMALELAIVAPVVIAMLLTVVAFGRVTHGRQLVDEAAAVGGRAAALATSPAQAAQEARSAVTATLAQAGVSCRSTRVDVDTSAFVPGGQVIVTVHCASDLSALALTGLPGQIALSATSHTPLETYRDLSGGTP
jgi:Flp pilus assembly protein TadG